MLCELHLKKTVTSLPDEVSFARPGGESLGT